MKGLIKVLLVLLLVAGLGTGARAAQSASSAEKVKTEIRLSKNVIPAGDSAATVVVLNIKKGWHVNAHHPTYSYLIGTQLRFDTLSGVHVVDFRYPESKRFAFSFARDSLDVYQGRAPIFVTLSTSSGLSPGSYTLRGKLTIQACNKDVCLTPSTIDISIPLEIVAQGTGFKSINRELFSAYKRRSPIDSGPASVSQNSDSIASLFSERGAILAFLGIFLIGLALNLTPCVYPMLSVTVSLFGGKADRMTGTWQSFKLASTYVLGIVSMYSILGVAAAYTGSLFGNWLQSPVLLAIVGLILLVMSVSMFGLFELQLPQWLLQKLGSGSHRVGPAGHFLSGVMVGLFAAPCIGPPVVALLMFVGSRGDPMFGLSVFFVMALGLGAPYLLLGTFSGLLTKLPGSGMWMIWIKKLFAVILTGAGLFFLGLALFPKYVLYTLPPVMILGGLYLGFLERSGRELKAFVRIKWIVGIAGIAGGLLITQNLMKPGIRWEPYRPAKLQEAVDAGSPVMLDFYADWCIPCLELDRITFTDPGVIAALDSYRTIKVDLTDYASPEAEAIRRKFGVAGVPTLIFLDPKGNEIGKSRIVGFVNPKEFLKRMPRGEPE